MENPPMRDMRKDDMIWIVAVTLIAVTLNPVLKFIGLLPADLFRSWGIFYPGLPQIVFGPLMAFLLLLLFLKTGRPMVFPVIGLLRAISLSFVFPANLEHSGTLLAAIVAGFVAAALLERTERAGFGMWLPLLAGLYASLYAACNYLTTFVFGPSSQTAVILASPLRAVGVVIGSFVFGSILGLLACVIMRRRQARVVAPLSPRLGI
jgi:uncharacterized membrane protein YeaQ/YmgE (transglycosylase-associated protein family)